MFIFPYFNSSDEFNHNKIHSVLRGTLLYALCANPCPTRLAASSPSHNGCQPRLRPLASAVRTWLPSNSTNLNGQMLKWKGSASVFRPKRTFNLIEPDSLYVDSENYRNIHSHKSCIGGKRHLSITKEEEVKWFLMVGKISVHQ